MHARAHNTQVAQLFYYLRCNARQCWAKITTWPERTADVNQMRSKNLKRGLRVQHLHRQQTRRRRPNYDRPGNVLLWSRCVTSAVIFSSCFMLFGTKWICVTWAEFQGSWLRLCLRPGSVLLCFAFAWLQSVLLSHAFSDLLTHFLTQEIELTPPSWPLGSKSRILSWWDAAKPKKKKRGKHIFHFQLYVCTLKVLKYWLNFQFFVTIKNTFQSVLFNSYCSVTALLRMTAQINPIFLV